MKSMADLELRRPPTSGTTSYSSFAFDLRVVRALAMKDIRSSLVERAFTTVSFAIPINFLLFFLLFAISGGQAPTAVVLDDHGPYARQFVDSMRQARSFVVQETSADQARRLMDAGQIVAIVTVPASFDEDVRDGRPISVPVTVNNLDTDLTNDIRRAVPMTIASFYGSAFPDRAVVRAQEVDLQRHDTDYIPYLAVSVVVVGLMLTGLLQAGANAAREYETGTIKELMLSPASKWAIELGKILGALAVNAVATTVVLAVIIVGLGVWPTHWGELIGFSLLLMVTFVAIGTLVGTLLKQQTPVIPLSIGISLPIFFVSGPFGPANWGTPAAAFLARLSPVYYAIAVFQHAFHGFNTVPTPLATNALVLAGCAVAASALSVLVLRQSTVAH